MNIANYWHDIDDWLEVLVRDGFTKLPPLDCFDLESYQRKSIWIEEVLPLRDREQATDRLSNT